MLVGVLYFGRFSHMHAKQGVPVGAVMTVITLLGRSLSGSKLNCLLLMFEVL